MSKIEKKERLLVFLPTKFSLQAVKRASLRRSQADRASFHRKQAIIFDANQWDVLVFAANAEMGYFVTI